MLFDSRKRSVANLSRLTAARQCNREAIVGDDALSVFAQYSLEMLLAQDLVQALAPHATNKRFADNIGIWRSIWSFQYSDIGTLGHSIEFAAELIVSAPHSRLSRAISWINEMVSLAIFGRPIGLDRRFHIH
jgi:hypothetical protein